MRVARNIMDEFETRHTLITRPRFTVFEAFSRELKISVILKQCEYSRVEEAESFIRSALMKTKDKVYSQPLLSIFAESDYHKYWICFMWAKGESLDPEVVSDRESSFPSGKEGYSEERRIIFRNSQTGMKVEKAQCLTLNRKVILKSFKQDYLIDMNPVFKEALVQARCTHSNICEFLDFCLFKNKRGIFQAYIVMEMLGSDLSQKIRVQHSKEKLYSEGELMDILQDVVSGLLAMKSQNFAHCNIKPSNIIRSSRGLKLIDFGSAWQKVQHSRTSGATGNYDYMSPEALNTLGDPRLMYGPFESDVFSLGMTMLHLAALKLPERRLWMSDTELLQLLQQEVQALPYSDEFKRLLICMLSIDPSARPSLESIRAPNSKQEEQKSTSTTARSSIEPIRVPMSIREAQKPTSISARPPPEPIRAQKSKQEAEQLTLTARSNYDNEDYVQAARMLAAADTIYYCSCPHDQDAANNLSNWANALTEMGSIEEALTKYSKAESVFSTFSPDDIDTASNLYYWGVALHKIGRDAEAISKITAANITSSRFLSNQRGTADSIYTWVLIQRELRASWALKASS